MRSGSHAVKAELGESPPGDAPCLIKRQRFGGSGITWIGVVIREAVSCSKRRKLPPSTIATARTKTIALLINVASSSKRASLRSREATNDPAYGADDAIDGERSGEGSGNPG